MTDEELLADLRNCPQRVAPSPLTRDRYDEIGIFSSAGIQGRFGSWNKAIRKAGLNVAPQQNKFRGTDDDYFEVIEAAWQRLGRPPTRNEVRHPESAVSGTSIQRHFGSWRTALERFVERVNSVHPESDSPDTKGASELGQSQTRRSCRAVGWRLRFLVLRRDGFRCRLCGASPAITTGVQLQVDHIEPWADGGDTVLENLQSTCDRCNGGKSALPCTRTRRSKATSGIR